MKVKAISPSPAKSMVSVVTVAGTVPLTFVLKIDKMVDRVKLVVSAFEMDLAELVEILLKNLLHLFHLMW